MPHRCCGPTSLAKSHPPLILFPAIDSRCSYQLLVYVKASSRLKVICGTCNSSEEMSAVITQAVVHFAQDETQPDGVQPVAFVEWQFRRGPYPKCRLSELRGVLSPHTFDIFLLYSLSHRLVDNSCLCRSCPMCRLQELGDALSVDEGNNPALVLQSFASEDADAASSMLAQASLVLCSHPVHLPVTVARCKEQPSFDS